MNRAEFMRRLTELLGDVSPTERDEAIQYYNDYFDDAGEENESGVIASLGTPEELSRTIKAGLSDGGASGEFTESGFSGYTQAHRDEIVRAGETIREEQKAGAAGTSGGTQKDKGKGGSAYYEQDYYRRTGGAGVYGGREDTRKYDNPYEQQGAHRAQESAAAGGQTSQPRQGMSGATLAIVIIVAILTSPVWIGLLGSLIGIVVGIMAVAFSIFLVFLIIGVVFVAVSIALLVVGIMLVFHAPLAGFCMIGTALILFAVGLVCVWLMVVTAGMAIPALVRGIVSLCRRLFHRGGARA